MFFVILFSIIGVLAVIAAIGYFVMNVGFDMYDGATKVIAGIVGFIILILALKGCVF